MRKSAALGVAVVALSGSLGFMGSTAVAAPSGGVSAQGAVPSCVKVKKTTQDEGYKTYKVTNKCAGTKKLKGLFKYGYDSACTSVKKNKTALLSSTQPWVGWDKVVTC
ncbi:hypothetical protein G3I40_17665 [Streptomyces sp. SID14478]|uniref:hypothetical protein n=1 Tax=Streptomyces sp. SID14478 TaxID=2706073 RepID=UPI0013DBC268|nr:hypothetical protein [Streptomyces sp. SID14478]NEB77033.1 hypothetical protein [Streptomyces sp. SID14478]